MYAQALLGILSVVGLLVVFYGPWQSFCTDWARQKIFESRDHIFDLALDGKLDFESDEYRQIRYSLNCLIRFAHDVTWMKYLVMILAIRNIDSLKRDRKSGSGIAAALNQIANNETRKQVRKHIVDAQRAAVLMMAYKSLPFAILLGLTQISKSVQKRAKPWAQSMRDKIQLEAEIACPSH